MRPVFEVIANGSNITELIADRLLSLEVVDQAGVESDSCSLEIDDRDQRLEFPERGAELEVALGYDGSQLVKMGVYIVDEVEISGPPLTMTIRAKATDMTKGIKAPKERSFPEAMLADVVETIAGEHDLEPAISDGLRERYLGHVDQTESDMQLLTRICTEQGAVMKIADGRLVVTGMAEGETATGLKLPPGVLDATVCESWSAAVVDRNDYKAVSAYWHDLATGERIEVKDGSGDPVLVLKHSYTTEDEAFQAASSKLKSMTRAVGKASVRGYVGDPLLAAEMPVSMRGFRSGVDGDTWVITSVKHSLTDGGYTCDIDLEARP